MAWCWIGSNTGSVQIASLARKELSTYQVAAKALGLTAPSEVMSVTQLQVEGGQLVIGLANGLVVLWDGAMRLHLIV